MVCMLPKYYVDDCLCVQDYSKRLKAEAAGVELRSMITQGQRLSSELLKVCVQDIQGKGGNISLSRDLYFNHKSTPCRLVIPLETTLMAGLPTVTENVNVKAHKAFSKDTVTISGMTIFYLQLSLYHTDLDSFLGRCLGSELPPEASQSKR